MFNATTYVGTCQAIGATWSSIDNFKTKAVPTTFCNGGIYQSSAINDVAQDSFVLTKEVVTANDTTTETQCYYCKDASSCTATCDTQYKASSSFGYSASQFCPCDNSCQQLSSSVYNTYNPVAVPTELPSFFPI
jgi:hypothetical protein